MDIGIFSGARLGTRFMYNKHIWIWDYFRGS